MTQKSNITSKATLGTAIGRRRSIRRYLPRPISRPVIERLLLAATQAPSAHNRQPWRFAIVDDAAGKQTLAAATGRRLRQDRTADGDDPLAIEADVARSHARLTEAPVIIVVCLDTGDMDRYPDARRRQAEFLMAVQSTAMAVQNLLLAAEREGLGACVMCAPLFCPDAVVDALGLSSTWQPQMLVTLGRRAKAGKSRPRLPLETVVAWPRRNADADSAG